MDVKNQPRQPSPAAREYGELDIMAQIDVRGAKFEADLDKLAQDEPKTKQEPNRKKLGLLSPENLRKARNLTPEMRRRQIAIKR